MKAILVLAVGLFSAFGAPLDKDVASLEELSQRG